MNSSGCVGITILKMARCRVELAALIYAWHSRHHVAHITHLRAREGW